MQKDDSVSQSAFFDQRLPDRRHAGRATGATGEKRFMTPIIGTPLIMETSLEGAD
ncbi:MAG: hypothetical protein OEU92_02025 [Alphaproteobacteria bacterium]|nr:hypothetical protein [Alphaproteobacteria bacterium]